MNDPLLDLTLSVDYPGKPDALRDVSVRMEAGEILGLVGQSGSGKSTLALAVLRLVDFKAGNCRGKIRFQGRDLMSMREKDLRTIRGREICFVPQSPLSALNPALRIGVQLTEAWKAHAGGGQQDGRRRILESLEAVSLPVEPSFLRRRPRQLSVGQAQRVLIAMAILHRPALLIADEPTSALDVITQSEVLALIAIMHEGEIVECGETAEIFRNPAHPYARKLIESLPKVPSASGESVLTFE
jgi:ABC-type glutathione transport system ATPase component